MSPCLTPVAAPLRELGALAVESIARQPRVSGVRPVDVAPVPLPATLKVRGSTAPHQRP